MGEVQSGKFKEFTVLELTLIYQIPAKRLAFLTVLTFLTFSVSPIVMLKFILVAAPRTGSELLATCLRQHQNVILFGELFNDEEEERQRAFYIKKSFRSFGEQSRTFYRWGDDANDFLNKYIFVNHWAVGFKILYNQARNEPKAEKAWDYLIENEDIHVIHLIRRNLLASLVSLKTALLTDEWVQLKDSPTNPTSSPTFRLDPQHCESYFEQTLERYQWIKSAFSRHPIIEIEYERDLCHQFEKTRQDLQDFLKITRQPLEKLLVKQAKRKLHDTIINYHELKDYFQNTDYEVFFQ
jgi:LPS sulfotransferase NodH